jgi:hypothetical protein
MLIALRASVKQRRVGLEARGVGGRHSHGPGTRKNSIAAAAIFGRIRISRQYNDFLCGIVSPVKNRLWGRPKVDNETARQIIQDNERLAKLVHTFWPWKSDDLPKGIGDMRKRVAQDNKQFAASGWEDICAAFTSPRLRKRTLSYMCLHKSISSMDAVAIVQYEIHMKHIKGEELEPTAG